MISFVNEDNETLDFSGDVGLTKQCANFFDFKIKGDVSVNLRLDNNSVNRRLLNYYGPNQSGVVVKVPFSMVQDSNVLSRGYVVVRDSDDKTISAFYISGNSNWFQDFQFNLKDIVFRDKFTVLANALDAQKSATEGIIFPLVDWWANGKRGADAHFSMIRAYTPDTPSPLCEIHPCLYLHTLVDEMARYAGVQIDGDLVDDKLYKKIIITPEGPEYFVPDSIIDSNWIRIAANQGVLYNDALDPQVVQLGSLIDGGPNLQYDPSTYSFTATVTGTYRADVELNVLPATTYDIWFYKNGSVLTQIQTGNLDSKSGTIFFNLNAGDYLQLFVDRTTGSGNYRMNGTGGRTMVTLKLEKRIGSVPAPDLGGYTLLDTMGYVIPNAICPDMKAIDLVKFLAAYFGCSVSYDEYSDTIKLNKIASFRRESAEDWSDFFVDAKTKWDNKVAANNFIQTKEGPEEDIVSYNAQSLVRYGGGTIETDFDAVETRDLFEIPFAGSYDKTNGSKSNMFFPYIKFYELEQVESVAYSGVVNAAGFAQFTSTFNNPIETGCVFYVISNSGAYTGFYPLFTSASATTSPQLFVTYTANDAGTIIMFKTTPLNTVNRLLVCNTGTLISDIGGSSVGLYLGTILQTTQTLAPACWFDKPIDGRIGIDAYKESLAIDSNKNSSVTISERYLGPIKEAFKKPMIEAEFNLPIAVFQNFNFDNYIYLETKDLTGYFLVQKIENYKDALTPVKVELLYG